MHKARTSPKLFFQLTAGLLLIARAQAAITLNANFDAGSLKSYSVSGNLVQLVGRDTYAGSGNFLGDGKWRWLYFRADGVQGLAPHFTISRDFAGDATPGPHELTDHQMVFSYDRENWDYFSNNQLGASTFDFSADSPFTENTVYVAYAFPYPMSRTQSHTEQVLATPWVEPTGSGNAAGVIGQSPAGIDEMGRLIAPQNLYAYRITNPATDGSVDKRRTLFTTGQHAGETLGIYTFEGLVDWLVSDDPRAAALRDRAEFFCYPSLNSSGRFAGLSRAMLSNPNSDSNGFWSPSRWEDRPEQKILGEAMLADVGTGPVGSLDLAVDFHSSVPDYLITGPQGEGTSGRDDWGYIKTNQGDDENPWWLALRELQPNLLEEPSGGGSNTTIGFAQNFLGADMDVTLENQFAISRPISYYHQLGRNVGLAMYEAWVRVADPLAGDFDEDGDVDLADLMAWRQGFGVASAEHWQGDADGNGVVDGLDFLVWQRQISVGSNLPVNTIPEPSTLLFAVSITVCVLTKRQ